MADLSEVFNHGVGFVTLPKGKKFPPRYKEWQLPENARTFAQAQAHVAKGGNAGILAGGGYIGLDKDSPAAFDGLELPTTLLWETRPGRFGMRFAVSDDIPAALATISKKPDLAQVHLYKDGQHVGEIKLQCAYQIIPPSWKTLEDGTRADYKLLDSSPPATITLAKLLADLQAIGISFSEKQKESRLDTNYNKLEDMGRKAHQRRTESDEDRTRRYALGALKSEMEILAGTNPGGRNKRLFLSTANLAEFVAVGALTEGEVIAELAPIALEIGLDVEEVRKTLHSGMKTGKKSPRPIPPPTIDNLMQSIDTEELTEGGNARRLERIHGNVMRFNHTLKRWLLWDGGRWKIDSNGGATRKGEDVVASIYLAASKADGHDAREKLTLHAWVTDSRKGINNMLALAATRERFALTADDFDKDPWLLGAGEVTIDLKTGATREPRQEDLITRAIGYRYDRGAGCPLWLKFIERTFPDKELQKYIQRAVGYCLTASMAEQIFFFCYGMGANGKSVFLAVLRALLGEYAKMADFSTFLVQRTEKVRNDLAALAGARVITAIESEEGGRLSMQVIKAWTGGDPITARFLFGEYFTFYPVGKLWLAANNKPAITERNLAAWRRVRLIPFTATIPEAERVGEYEKVLYPELPGILNWALEGLQDYQKNGMQTPKAVQDATNEYRRENDSLEQFVFECCETGDLMVCKNTTLYGTYQSFCTMSGLIALSQTKFSTELKTRKGITSTRLPQGMIWKGIALKEAWHVGLHNPTSIAGSSSDVGLEQNAQSTSNRPTRGDFAHFGSNPTPDSDATLHNPTLGQKSADNVVGIGPHPRKEITPLTGEKSEERFTDEEAALLGRICGRLRQQAPDKPLDAFVLAMCMKTNDHDIGISRARMWIDHESRTTN